MNEFPLNLFLASLESAGIRPTVRDYERLHTMLKTGGAWSLDRFRNTLLALFVKDPDQEDLFLRRFNAFFKVDPGGENAPGEIDAKRMLSGLRELVEKRRQAQEERRPEKERSRFLKREISDAPRLSKTRRWLSLVLIVILILGAAAIFHFQKGPEILEDPAGIPGATQGALTSPHPQDGLGPSSPTDPSTPSPSQGDLRPPTSRGEPNQAFAMSHLSQSELAYDKQALGRTDTREVTIENNGSIPLTVEKLSITGPNAKEFHLADIPLPKSVAAQGNLAIPVDFTPAGVGKRTAFLNIESNAKENPQKVALNGVGFDPLGELKRIYSSAPVIKDVQYIPI